MLVRWGGGVKEALGGIKCLSSELVHLSIPTHAIHPLEPSKLISVPTYGGVCDPLSSSPHLAVLSACHV